MDELRVVLDGAVRSGAVARHRRIEDADARDWYVTVWPTSRSAGDSSHLVIELRTATRSAQ